MSQGILTLESVHGYNKDIKNGVRSLTNENRKALVFASGHSAVIYDEDTGGQQLLQGHCNPISCLTVSRDRKWIFTGDVGRDSMIIVWNAETAVPVKNIFSPHPNGVIAMDLIADSTIIATLSAPFDVTSSSTSSQSPDTNDPAQHQQVSFTRDAFDAASFAGFDMSDIVTPTNTGGTGGNTYQEIKLWDWVNELDENMLITKSLIKTGDIQQQILFNETDQTELCTTGPRRVVYWRRSHKKGGADGNEEEEEEEDDEDDENSAGKVLNILRYHSPALNTKELHRNVGAFVQTVFFPHSSQSVTATVDGDFVLWDTPHYGDDQDISALDAVLGKNKAKSKAKAKSVTGVVRDTDRKVVKILRLHPKAASIIRVYDRFLLTGDIEGSVRFFDFQFRLMAWFEDINCGPISSLSTAQITSQGDSYEEMIASLVGNTTTASKGGRLGGTATRDSMGQSRQKDMDPRSVTLPDLIVGTTWGRIVSIPGSSFADDSKSQAAIREQKLKEQQASTGSSAQGKRGITKGGTASGTNANQGPSASGRGEILVRGQAGPLHGVAIHPHMPLAALASYSGTVTFYDFEKRKVVNERKFEKNPIHTVAFDPTGKYLAIGFRSGRLYVLQQDTSNASLSGAPISAEGSSAQNAESNMTNTSVNWVDVWQFKNSTDCVQRIVFSPDGYYMANSDRDRCVVLYRRRLEGEEMSADEQVLSEDGAWIYIGRNRCHRKQITGLEFALTSTGKYILFSIGADRRLVEFDVQGSSVLKGFLVQGAWQIEQTATPTACLYLPAARPPPEHMLKSANQGQGSKFGHGAPSGPVGGLQTIVGELAKKHAAEQAAAAALAAEAADPDLYKANGLPRSYGSIGPGDVILIANSEYKFKFLDAVTKKVRRVILAPSYGQPVSRFLTLNPHQTSQMQTQQQSSSQSIGIASPQNAPFLTEAAVQSNALSKKYIGYITPDRIVGMLKLPLDGNLFNTMGLIAHPGTVSDASFTNDGQTLLTVGGDDYTMFAWHFDPEAMETSCILQNQSINGSAVDTSVDDNEALSQYSQTQYAHQLEGGTGGEDTTIPRKITGLVPLTQVPNIVRAIGFFPTEKEVSDLINDLEWFGRERDGKVPTTVNLNEFMRVYVNHRPVKAPSQGDLDDAFRKLGAEPLTGVLSSNALLNALLTQGEPIPPEVLAECMNILTKKPMAEMRENMTAIDFAQEILGFSAEVEQDEEGYEDDETGADTGIAKDIDIIREEVGV